MLLIKGGSRQLPIHIARVNMAKTEWLGGLVVILPTRGQFLLWTCYDLGLTTLGCDLVLTDHYSPMQGIGGDVSHITITQLLGWRPFFFKVVHHC